MFILGTAAAGILEAQEKRAAAKPDSGRRVYPLNRRWLFGGKTAPGVAAADFNDAAWQPVTLPHSNVRLPWHSFDERSYQYVAAYRRHFRALAEWKGKRVFLDFAGAMTATTVTVNGHKFDEYKGGYTPFSLEIGPHLRYGADNVIAVEVDSTERADIPPFGDNIDYLTFGGIYRGVELRVVPETFIENVYAKPVAALTAERSVAVRCYLEGPIAGPATLTAELRDGEKVLKTASVTVKAEASYHEIALESLPEIELWSLRKPKLYGVVVKLTTASGAGDEYRTRIGFREARYTPDGFMLNGERVKLMGLNRHQTFPYVGGAMPERVQRRDAWILRRGLHANIVRTSHYPQSPAFLDACDELGLLVIEEIPGWQHIGDQAWQDVAVRNVGEMIRRDWNHPSIVLWGVRINESKDNHELYTRTNALAHSLDDGRQTGGIRYLYETELLEDVMTMNDFGFPLRPPNHPLYMNTEFSGHMFSTKRADNVERVAEHVARHARVHNQLASDNRYAGGTGWCAFDYNTHFNFGSGDHICYHGVSDIFRIPKPAAYFYASQCSPEEEIVLQAGFFLSQGDRSAAGGVHQVPILSNCDHLKVYWIGELRQELDPDRKTYAHLKHPPFTMDLGELPLSPWGDLKIEGYIGGKLVKTLTLSSSGIDADFKVLADDAELIGDGRDATRVVVLVTDEFGNIRPFATAAIALSLTGPGEIIGENPLVPAGGAAAIWVRAKETSGLVNLTATHPFLGSRSIAIRVAVAEAETV
jgi:beta-galactosidase